MSVTVLTFSVLPMGAQVTRGCHNSTAQLVTSHGILQLRYALSAVANHVIYVPYISGLLPGLSVSPGVCEDILGDTLKYRSGYVKLKQKKS
jgi:hypothetical protein